MRVPAFPKCHVARVGSGTICHMWAEFIGALPSAEKFSTGTPVFPSPQKPVSDLNRVDFCVCFELAL